MIVEETRIFRWLLENNDLATDWVGALMSTIGFILSVIGLQDKKKVYLKKLLKNRKSPRILNAEKGSKHSKKTDNKNNTLTPFSAKPQKSSKRKKLLKKLLTPLNLLKLLSIGLSLIYILGFGISIFISKADYIKVPDVEGLNRDYARKILVEAGFEGSCINDILPTDGLCVISQSIERGEIIKKGRTITLRYATIEEFNNSRKSITASKTQSKSSPSLFVRVDDYEIYEKGFYYKEPFAKGSNGLYRIVEFQRGISGHFSFSGQLINADEDNWTLDGKIYDETRKECNIETTFFFSKQGVFAIELPEYLPKGNYICVLHLTDGTDHCEAEIFFQQK